MHFFVAKLLSVAVMTYSYVYHLRNRRPTNLLRTQRINFSMQPLHVRMTRDPTVIRSPLSIENPCEYPNKLYTAIETRVPEIRDGSYSIGLSLFNFTQ